MARILCFETATPVCSVALVEDSRVIALAEDREGQSHAAKITLLAEAVMQQAGMKLQELDAIAVSKGPGSYTGLRVGVSTAKGLCYALNLPLIAVNTLEALTHGAQLTIYHSQPGREPAPVDCELFIPMIDARRMEVFCAVYDKAINEVLPAQAKIIDEQSFADLLEHAVVYFFGTGAAKCRNVITHPNARFPDEVECSAAHMAGPVSALFDRKQFEDVAYFEPFYLKDFVGTRPKKLL